MAQPPTPPTPVGGSGAAVPKTGATVTPSFGEALRFWVKLGFISFGGPAGQIAIMHRELVERRRWIGEARFLHALNYCMVLPGPEAQQLATYIGWLLHRTLGGLVAGGFFVLPSVFILLALSYVYAGWGTVPAVAAVLAGIKPVVVAIVVEALVKIGRRALTRPALYDIAALAFVAIYWLHVPFPLIVLAAAAIGLALPAAPVAAATEVEEPLPAHARPDARRTRRTLAVGLVLWALPLLLVVLRFGWDSLYARLYRFFSGAALVTFGGAYAVLAYVTQVATSNGWLTKAQAIDGLALAETTPGPLIMVLQFVGFIAGWSQPQELSPAASALLAALLTTWATFLPCFVFIFVGAPYVEQVRGNRAVAAALSGVTAAVVGVVLNLAMVFGVAVIWHDGVVDWRAALLTAAACLALFRYHVDVLWVILGGAVLGLLLA